MQKLIDANEFRKALDMRGRMFMPGEKEDLTDAVPYFAERTVFETLDEQPTVDAAMVVHGRWERSEPGYRICSHCKADVSILSGHRSYCPNCGAKMDGV